VATLGCDPFLIRDYLKHMSVTMTDRYLSTRMKDMRTAVNGLRGAEVIPFARRAG